MHREAVDVSDTHRPINLRDHPARVLQSHVCIGAEALQIAIEANAVEFVDPRSRIPCAALRAQAEGDFVSVRWRRTGIELASSLNTGGWRRTAPSTSNTQNGREHHQHSAAPTR